VYSYQQIAAQFGVHFTTVGQIAIRIVGAFSSGKVAAKELPLGAVQNHEDR
jgi:hypothetical protein